jgi:hypothetical protein
MNLLNTQFWKDTIFALAASYLIYLLFLLFLEPSWKLLYTGFFIYFFALIVPIVAIFYSLYYAFFSLLLMLSIYYCYSKANLKYRKFLLTALFTSWVIYGSKCASFIFAM